MLQFILGILATAALLLVAAAVAMFVWLALATKRLSSELSEQRKLLPRLESAVSGLARAVSDQVEESVRLRASEAELGSRIGSAESAVLSLASSVPVALDASTRAVEAASKTCLALNQAVREFNSKAFVPQETNHERSAGDGFFPYDERSMAHAEEARTAGRQEEATGETP